MKAAILIEGLPLIDKPEAVKNVQFETQAQLIKYLKSEQNGWCEDEKPKINKSYIDIHGKRTLRINCYSDADWSYTALIGRTFKNKPVEILPL